MSLAKMTRRNLLNLKQNKTTAIGTFQWESQMVQWTVQGGDELLAPDVFYNRTEDGDPQEDADRILS